MQVAKRFIVFLAISASILHLNEAGNAVLINNGFQNVTVAISSAIQQSQQSSIINGIQNLFEAATDVLFTATGKRAYFATVILNLPPNWSNGDDFDLLASSESSESESYYEADFRIAEANAAYGDLPYTQQSRGCGKTGDFIHLTPTFITGSTSIESKYGPAEHLLVHEWVKYRYGVFDENGFAFDYTYPQQYFGTNGTEYNMCNNTVLVWSNSTCTYDSDIQGIPSHCYLQVSQSSSYNNNITSSILSMVTVPRATTFCNETSHNSEAPNKQNSLCDGKSAMEVILEHEDFQNGKNPPSNLNIPNPAFYENSQYTSATIVFFLVWDPMTLDQTFYTAGPALLKFIYLDFPEESYFGAIDTVDTIEPFVDLTRVVYSNREAIYDQILATLRTSEVAIGNVMAAVDGAISEIQSAYYISDFSKSIIVMSNTRYETDWDAVCNTTASHNLKLYLVTYSVEVALEYDESSYCTWRAILISANTQNFTGINITFPEDSVDTELPEDIQECLTYLEERKQFDLALLNFPALISSSFAPASLFHLRTYLNSSEDTFAVENSNLDSTYFYVETCTNLQEHPPTTLLSCWLGDEENGIQFDTRIQAFYDNSPLTEDGVWSFGVSQITTRGIYAPYTVYAIQSSLAKSSLVYNISTTMQILIEADHIEYSDEDHPKVQIFASLNFGTSPIFDARVTAKVANSVNSQVGEVILLDNGSGNPDITANDGVYSSYFTQLVNSDELITYYVYITADDNNGLATYPTNLYPWVSGSNSMSVEYCEPFFQREVDNFNFQLKTKYAEYPSGRIYDLRVVATQGSTVTLEWTAPGANYDSVIASGYFFKCTTDRDELINNFDNLPDISEIPPVYPGTPTYTQTATFEGINDKKTHFCAIKVWEDEAKNVLPYMSNVISYHIESR